MKKKVLSSCLAAFLLLGLLPSTALAAFPDAEGHWAANAIQRWSDAGVVAGGSDGSFHPDTPVTRAELAAILCRLFGYEANSQQTYADVPAGAWYAEAMDACAAAGVMTGDGARLYPQRAVTRQEAVTVLGRAFSLPEAAAGTESFRDCGTIASWALPMANAMSRRGYIQGNGGRFLPEQDITRGEIVTILDNMVDYYIDAPGPYTVTGSNFTVVAAEDVVLLNAGYTGTVLTAGNGSYTQEIATSRNSSLVAEAATGTYVGSMLENGLIKYSNIAYAEAERWQAPESVPASDAVIPATAGVTTVSIQSRAPGKPQEEGPLTLDIYVNPAGTSDSKGVLVWNTCGGGTASDSNSFDPTTLVLEHPDVIVVVANIRVSYFGCIDLSLFPDYDDVRDTYQYSNNLMRLDYLAALKWVAQNIAAFGGNPENVTIGGQSAGAANASSMLLMKEALPYFDKVIMESGVALDRISLATLEESRKAAEIFMESTGVRTLSEALELEPQALLDAEAALTENCIGAYLPGSQSKTFTTVIDHVVIPQDYWSIMEQAAESGVKILVGTTNGEYDRDLAGKSAEEALSDIISANWGKLDPARGGAANADEIIQGYVDRSTQYGRDVITAYKDLKNDINQKVSAVLIAEAFSKTSTSYLFSYEWYAGNDQGMRATHGSEKKALYPTDNSVPEALASSMRSAWASFILFGDPNEGNADFVQARIQWRPYNASDRWIMAFDQAMRLDAGQRVDDIEALMPLFAEYGYLRGTAN